MLQFACLHRLELFQFQTTDAMADRDDLAVVTDHGVYVEKSLDAPEGDSSEKTSQSPSTSLVKEVHIGAVMPGRAANSSNHSTIAGGTERCCALLRACFV